MKKRHGQMSEAFLTAALLSASGGLQDAYTYIARGEVFANAQTGNIVLLSQNLFSANWGRVLHYLFPLMAFGLGVAVAELIRWRFQKIQAVHWRQLVLLVEILLLLSVGLLPEQLNVLANALVSFSCAMQVQAFRKVDGYSFASTMCIGNLRSGVESLMAGGRTGDKKLLIKAGHYFLIILLFALGAGVGGLSIHRLGYHTIWLSCALLTVVFLVMFIREDLEENPDIQAAQRTIHRELQDIGHKTAEIARDLHQEIKQQEESLRDSSRHSHDA